MSIVAVHCSIVTDMIDYSVLRQRQFFLTYSFYTNTINYTCALKEAENGYGQISYMGVLVRVEKNGCSAFLDKIKAQNRSSDLKSESVHLSNILIAENRVGGYPLVE